MRALTLWQPWSSLVIRGLKPIEYRAWPAPSWVVGQRIVIHASNRPPAKHIAHLLDSDENIRGSCGPTCDVETIRTFLTRALEHPGVLPLGAGLGTVEVGLPLRADVLYARAGLKIGGEGPWNIGWPMLDVLAWDEPVPCRGAQGFWNWPLPVAEGPR